MFLRGPSVGGGRNVAKNFVGQMLSPKDKIRIPVRVCWPCLLVFYGGRHPPPFSFAFSFSPNMKACTPTCGREGIVVGGECRCHPDQCSNACPLHVCGWFISIVMSAALSSICGVIESEFGVETTLKCHLQAIYSFMRFSSLGWTSGVLGCPPHPKSYGNSKIEPPKVIIVFR